jgi:hypothetical protein
MIIRVGGRYVLGFEDSTSGIRVTAWSGVVFRVVCVRLCLGLLVGVAEEHHKRRAFLPDFPFLTQPLCSWNSSLLVTSSSSLSSGPRLVLISLS